MFLKAYFGLVLKRPKLTIIGVLLLTITLGWFTQYFTLDASSDALVAEGDGDLEFSRLINQRYNNGEFVFVTYSPHQQEMFSPVVLGRLKSLLTELETLPIVESIDSILDVPLFKVANVSLSEVADNLITLDSPDIDLNAARADLISSDAYRNVLLSEDGNTAALVVNFVTDIELSQLQSQRSILRQLVQSDAITSAQTTELKQVETNYDRLNADAAAELHANILQIRQILETYKSEADIYMGGVPMIADDLISFVKSDLRTFGLLILLFIIISLAYLFRKTRYVLIPLLCCGVTAICITGLLGVLNWPVTVISSNFLSLLLIITISLTVHLMVRYRELEAAAQGKNHLERIELTLSSMIKPCAYTSLTTIVAFGSLLISDIPPIINFGLMMVLGVLCAFLLTFLIFPAVFSLLQESPSTKVTRSIDVTPWLAHLTANHGSKVLIGAALIFIISLLGMSKLKVENSFIDYFDKDTDIYQGMVFIDQNMGGTTPLNVIIEMNQANPFGSDDFSDDAFDDFDEFNELTFDDADGSFEENLSNQNSYWFTSDKMNEIMGIHDFLEGVPHVGKVLSLGTLIKIAHELNDDQPLDSLELGVLYNSIPEDYKDALLKPYVSVENDQVRFSIRILETDPDLVRSDLLRTIREGLETQFNFSPEQVHLTGMLVLYNNMLQSLFSSQILTLAVVLGAIMLMFVILFQSIKLAIIGIIPNILAASVVLGLMGWGNIPLDMMTITIAAISVGIGVDNTIHYIHRFKSQFPHHQDYRLTMMECHRSIGQAMFFTSFTIVVGFSLLVFSSFIPTIYFGLLTSLAMVIALCGALTLLPQLLIIFKPLKIKTV